MIQEILPHIYRWTKPGTPAQGELSAFAVRFPNRATGRSELVLIDPLEEDGVPEAGAIVLTTSLHERDAGFFRRKFGCEVHAPRAAVGHLRDRAVSVFDPGDRLPGGLLAIGFGANRSGDPKLEGEVALLLESRGVLFVGDHLGTHGKWTPRGAPLGRHPSITADALLPLREVVFDALCVGHGPPILNGARACLLDLLRSEGF